MDRVQAKETAKGYLESYLRDKGINTGRPFNCLNPEHQDKHPSMSYDRQRKKCHCFSCGADYDLFDIIGIDYGLTDQAGIFKKAYEYCGITVDRPAEPPKQRKGTTVQDDIKKWQDQFTGSPAAEYVKARGLSEDLAKQYGLGYAAEFKTQNEGEDGKRAYATWRALIVPTGSESYTARNIDQPQVPAEKNRIRKRGASVIFNSKALYEAQKPVMIVEGELDALSVIEAGGEAVGLGSTSNYSQLVRLIEEKQPAQPLILALDADEAGQKTEKLLAEELTRLQTAFYRYNPYGTAKDANEALQADREGFIAEVAAAQNAQEAELEAAAEAARHEYLKTSAAEALGDFIGGIGERANTPAISTGFANLDAVLDGGLYEGLYIIGAISSLGKTTLALQIIDQLAQQGQDCLVFSLEMARSELMAKSISRLTFLAAGDRKLAKTTRGITAGARYEHYSPDEKKAIFKAMDQYGDYAQHIFIHEGVGDIGVRQIRDTVQRHISVTGNKPVILIDYLQILAPYNDRATDKQNTDKATLELKRISRDFKIPVIGISSFNRDNYTAPVNNASFKESGAIEYSADVLIGLQYEGMDYSSQDKSEGARQVRIRELIKSMNEKARTGQPQRLQAKILKNRNGSKGEALLDFYAMFNCFKEDAAGWEPAEQVDIFSDMIGKAR